LRFGWWGLAHLRHLWRLGFLHSNRLRHDIGILCPQSGLPYEVAAVLGALLVAQSADDANVADGVRAADVDRNDVIEFLASRKERRVFEAPTPWNVGAFYPR
jgi:hypothetical protein